MLQLKAYDTQLKFFLCWITVRSSNTGTLGHGERAMVKHGYRI